MSTVKHTIKCFYVRRTTRVADVSFACYFLLSRYFFHCHRRWVCFLFVYLLILNKYPVLVIWFSVCGQVPKNGTKSNQSLNTQAFKMKAVVFFLYSVVSSIPFAYLEPNNIASNQFISYFVVFLCFSSHWSGLPTFKTFYAKYKFKTINCVRYIIHHESQRLEMFKWMENTHPTIQKWKLRKIIKKYQQQKKLDWILKKFNGFYSFSVIMVLKNKLWTHRLSENGARFSHVQ